MHLSICFRARAERTSNNYKLNNYTTQARKQLCNWLRRPSLLFFPRTCTRRCFCCSCSGTPVKQRQLYLPQSCNYSNLYQSWPMSMSCSTADAALDVDEANRAPKLCPYTTQWLLPKFNFGIQLKFIATVSQK